MNPPPAQSNPTIRRYEDVTPAVLKVMERTEDPRLREILVSLVKHLHGFVLDVRLTEAEFREATAILNQLGQQSSDSHNESVLMAGSLGISSLICLLNNGNQGQTETSQNLLGPFLAAQRATRAQWRYAAPLRHTRGSAVRQRQGCRPAGCAGGWRRGRCLARLPCRSV